MPLKILLRNFALLGLAAVCLTGHSRAENPLEDQDLKKAVASLRRGTTPKEVERSLAIIEVAAFRALPFLLAQIDNKEIAAGAVQQPLLVRDPSTGEPTGWRKSEVGDVAIDCIRTLIEGRRSTYHSEFTILSRSNVKQWIVERSHKSLLELRVEAAKSALELVKAGFDEGPKRSEAVALFEKRIKEIKEGASPDMDVIEADSKVR